MRFVYGVVEISKDSVVLNISRETFQKDDPSIQKIKSILVKKILSELKKVKQNDLDKYLEF